MINTWDKNTYNNLRRISLIDSDIEKIKKIYEEVHPELILLVGSRSVICNTNNSDYDFVFVCNNNSDYPKYTNKLLQLTENIEIQFIYCQKLKQINTIPEIELWGLFNSQIISGNESLLENFKKEVQLKYTKEELEYNYFDLVLYLSKVRKLTKLERIMWKGLLIEKAVKVLFCAVKEPAPPFYRILNILQQKNISPQLINLLSNSSYEEDFTESLIKIIDNFLLEKKIDVPYRKINIIQKLGGLNGNN